MKCEFCPADDGPCAVCQSMGQDQNRRPPAAVIVLTAVVVGSVLAVIAALVN